MKWLDWLAPKRAGNTQAAKSWPNYIFRGRMRTSTATLILAFIALFWVNQTFQPAPSATAPDANQVVPPGFVPDPNYTWVPRTNVAPSETSTTRTTTTTTTTTTTPSPTPSPSESDATTPSTTTGTVPGGASTTVIDPDGPGPLGPITFTAPPILAPTSVPPPGAPATTTALPPQ